MLNTYRLRRASQSTRVLRFESLESRILLAGTPLSADADTTFLFHFDGTAKSASGFSVKEQVGFGYEAGLIDGAAHLSSPGYLKYRNSSVFARSGTVEFWIKPDWNGNTGSNHVFFEVGDNFNNGVLIGIDGANNLRFIQWGDDPATAEIEKNVERGVATGASGWVAGQWHHIAAAWDSFTGHMALYIDGQLVDSRTDAVRIAFFVTEDFFIGSETNGLTPAQAAFDEFRISRRARSAAEVLNSFQLITDATSPASARGALDTRAPGVELTGWAYQPAMAAASLNIQVRIDNEVVANQVANLARPDINARYGISGEHGFAFQIPTSYLDGPAHQLEIFAEEIGTDNLFRIANETIGNRAAIGQVEVKFGRTFGGLAYDLDTPEQAVTIQAYVDSQLVGTTLANLPRPDFNTSSGVPGNHGWSFTIPVELVEDAAQHNIEFRAVDTSTMSTAIVIPFNLLGDSIGPGEPFPGHSNPGAPVSIFLDFDGNHEATWNGYSNVSTPVFDFDGMPHFYSEDEVTFMSQVFGAVAEDFALFNVDVTNVDPGSFSNRVGLKVSIGGDGDWYDASSPGAARLGSFTNTTPNTVFVFPDRMAFASSIYPNVTVSHFRAIADAVSHHIGIALGLYPQSAYDSGELVEVYNRGSEHSAPLMGNSYTSTYSRWHIGPTPIAENSIQDDIAVISNPNVGPDNGISIRVDDFGDDRESAAPLDEEGLLGGGVIEDPTDADYFSFSLPNPFILVATLATAGELKANLEPILEIRSSQGDLLASAIVEEGEADLSLQNYPPGNYFAVVHSTGGYGNVGRYTLSLSGMGPQGEPIGKIELPPPNLPLPPTSLPASGDFDTDGIVDDLDWLSWVAAFGQVASPLGTGADGNADGMIGAADYTVWRDNVGRSQPGQAAVSETAVTGTFAAAEVTVLSSESVVFADTRQAASGSTTAERSAPSFPPASSAHALASRDAVFTALSSPNISGRPAGSFGELNLPLLSPDRFSADVLLIDAAIDRLEQPAGISTGDAEEPRRRVASTDDESDGRVLANPDRYRLDFRPYDADLVFTRLRC